MIRKNVYNIIPYDKLLVVESFGSWDLGIATEYLEDVLKIITQYSSEEPYAILDDKTKWELKTPDAMAFWKEILANEDTHFPTHIAYAVGESELKKWSVERIFDDSVPFEVSFFGEVLEAVAWLDSHGYYMS